MNTPAADHSRTGAVLVFSLLLLVVGALVLGGVAQMTATQSVAGETEWIAAQRRITLENSRAMARQYLLERMFLMVPPTGVTNINTYGAFWLTNRSEVGSFWDALRETNASLESNFNLNPFNVMERGGYYRVWIEGGVSDGMTNESGALIYVSWAFQVRSRSPIAAGYTFVKQRPSPASTILYASEPYIDMTAAGFVGFPGLPRPPMSSVTNTDPSLDPPEDGYAGYLSAPIPTNNMGIFTNTNPPGPSPTNGDVLQLRVDLGATDDDTNQMILRYSAPTNLFTYINPTTGETNTNQVESLVLEGPGQYAETNKPLLIVIEGTNIRTITLENSFNSRRLYLIASRPAPTADVVTVRSTNGDTWRLGMTFDNVPVQFDTGSTKIVGGVRVNNSVNGSAPVFLSESNALGLDAIADRMMWLEDISLLNKVPAP